ncbi:MAG: hypothetical protein FJ295_02495 [Planctomycetes bacterium]|nr:hypothetical protein [Planctomycetota bacterium]
MTVPFPGRTGDDWRPFSDRGNFQALLAREGGVGALPFAAGRRYNFSTFLMGPSPAALHDGPRDVLPQCTPLADTGTRPAMSLSSIVLSCHLFADLDLWGQKLATSDLAVILLLVLLEGLLSIDNALVLGLLAKRLPPHQRTRALSYGLIGALVFRIIAISVAGFLLRWTAVKFVGGAYLVYIAVRHIFFETHEAHEDKIILDEQGQPQLVDSETGQELTTAEIKLEILERVPIGGSLVTDEMVSGSDSQEIARPSLSDSQAGGASTRRGKHAGFWRTVLVIELTDVAFAVDSILAAMALAGGRFEKRWLVIAGGFLGVVLMRFAAAVFIRLLERFPRFEISAYLLVAIIGFKLLADWSFNGDWSFRDSMLATRMPPTWKARFEDVEVARVDSVRRYEDWLDRRWIFGLNARSVPDPEAPAGIPAIRDPNQPLEIPHLLDFHDIRRPECMSFWALMMVCFCLGFLPRKTEPAAAVAP